MNTAINQMDQGVQRNAAMVEEATAASHALTGEAADLTTVVSRFRMMGEQTAKAARREPAADAQEAFARAG